MGAFCVFGVSRAASKQIAEKKTSEYEGRRALSIAEWAARRDALAELLFATCEKPYRISPEFDAPQFCHDWMAAAPGEIKLAKVMVRGPKFDGGGKPVKRNGVQVMTWHEFTGVNQFAAVRNEA